jgi:hypothetical protein
MKFHIYQATVKRFLLLGFLWGMFFAPADVFSQSNPGFLGARQGFSVGYSLHTGGLLRAMVGNGNETTKLLNSGFRVDYEMAKSQGFSWLFSYRNRNDVVESDDYNGIYYSDTWGGIQKINIQSGTLNYNVNEVAVEARFYSERKGAMAPFGSYVGLELSASNCSPTSEDVVWTAGMNFPKYSGSLTSIATSLNFGIKRMITKEIGINAHYGFGFTVYQTGNVKMGTEDVPTNSQDFYDYAIARRELNAKLLQGSISVSYLF